MLRSAFPIFLFCLLAAACKKDQSNPTNNTSNTSNLGTLQGQWMWIRQTRSIAVNGNPESTVTAAELGLTEFLNMNSDLTWSLVANSVTVRNGTYRIDTIISPGGPINGGPIGLLDFVNQGKDSLVNHWLSEDNDTLLTSNVEVDSTWNVDMYVRWRGTGSIY